jgi:hypothetical protein
MREISYRSPAANKSFDENIIGENIELLLLFTLQNMHRKVDM